MRSALEEQTLSPEGLSAARDANGSRCARQAHRVLLDVAIALAIAIGFTAYIHSCVRFPYYFSWDMDMFTTVDLLLAQDGRAPEHTNHPGFGTYLVLVPSQRLAHALGAVSVLGLEDLKHCLDPLAAVAQLAGFVRLHSPVLCLVIVLCLWGGLRLLFAIEGLASLGLLVYLLSLEGFGYQAALDRSELFAIVFWSFGFVALAAAAPRRRPVWLFAAGLLMGTGYLTKFQALFLMIVPPLILALVEAVPGPVPRARREPLYLAACAGCGAALFAVLVGLSCRELRAVPAVLLTLHLAVVASLLHAWIRPGPHQRALDLPRANSLVLAGFDASLLLPLVIPGSGPRLERFVRVTEIACCGAGAGEGDMWSAAPTTLLQHASHDPLTFAALAAVALGAAAGCLRSSAARRRRCLALLGLVTVTLAQTALGCRFILRDLVWVQVLATVTLVAAIGHLAATFPARDRWLGIVIMAALAFATAAQGGRRLQMQARLDANYNLYGWQERRWTDNIYAGAHVEYRNYMHERYTFEGRDLRPVALRQARRESAILRDVRFVVLDRALDHHRVGVLSEGFPLWVSDLALRVKALPEALREAAVVDLSAAEPLRRLAREHVVAASEYLEKLRPPTRGTIAVLPRPDLRVFLFLTQEPPSEVRDCMGQQAGTIVARGNGELSLTGRELVRYCELELASLGRSPLVVVAAAAP